MIQNDSIEKVRALPIEQVAEKLGLGVSRHKALCPFHSDRHPSLMFRRGKNSYRCFVCGAYGGPIDLAMRLTDLPFAEAVRYLGKLFGIEIEGQSAENLAKVTPRRMVPARKPEPEPRVDTRHLSLLVAQPYLSDEARRFLFDVRKLHPAVVRWLGISSISSPVPMSGDYRSSWFNAPALLIPYRNQEGRLLSVQARYLGEPSADRSTPRFQFPRGSRCSIFNLPVLALLQPQEELWITEGVTDCMAMLSSGRKAIAIPSATLLKQPDVALLARLSHRLGTSFHCYPDQDAAGERLYLDLKERLPNLTHHQLPEGYKDFGQWWASR